MPSYVLSSSRFNSRPLQEIEATLHLLEMKKLIQIELTKRSRRPLACWYIPPEAAACTPVSIFSMFAEASSLYHFETIRLNNGGCLMVVEDARADAQAVYELFVETADRLRWPRLLDIS